MKPEDCQNFTIDTKFSSSLSTDQVLNIVEGGIKLLLFQRGQIPQPFDLMSAQKNNFSGPSNLWLEKNDDDELNESAHTVEFLTPIERISYFREKTKQERDKKKMNKIMNRIKAQEITCRKLFEEIFMIIRDVFKRVVVLKGSIIAIVFGTSIYNPKEVYLINVDEELFEDSNSLHLHLENDSLHTRRFFKSLITNPDLIGLKSLKRTFTHICLFLKDPLDNQQTGLNVRLLENPTFHMKIKRSKFTTFHIKLSKSDTTRIRYSNENYFFESNSHICYQLPLRFKGFECKRKF